MLRIPVDVIMLPFGICLNVATILADAREAAEIADLDADARDAFALLFPPRVEDEPSENVGIGWGSS